MYTGWNQSTTHKFFVLTAVLNTDVGLCGLVKDLEREVLEIRLHFGIIELATDKTFRVEDTSGRSESNDIVIRLHQVHTCCGDSSRLGSSRRRRSDAHFLRRRRMRG